ncbi:MAG: elongation factor P, partial [Thermoflexales bacterium]|nr:elongation factor P [Thermoflexales bacterium]
YSKSGRGASVCKIKYQSLLSGAIKEEVFKADVRFEVAVLDRKAVHYSYHSEPIYVFMDEEYNQIEVGKEAMGNALNFLEEGMTAEVVFYDGKPISIELPPTVVCEVQYTEPAVRGDTSGKVTKPATLKGSGYEILVPAFIATGDRIEVDTRTNEYRKRM